MPIRTPASSRPSGRPRSRWRRPAILVAAVALLVGVAAACEPVPPDTTPPSWLLVDRAHQTALGPHVLLDWDAAQGSPTRYRIDVNGVTATILQPSATRCVMVGLAAATTYTFRITAYDAAGNWSGSLPPDGRHDPGDRAASATTPAGPGGGPTRRCVPTTDADGDRLPDALETDTGTYVNAASTGSDPAVVDTDGDGIDDGDEVVGTPDGLDLLALGTRPTRLDLLVEVDWLGGYTSGQPCGNPNLAPTPARWAAAVDGFAQMPVGPGGSGVNLIVDHGQGGPFTGGNAIADADGRVETSGSPRPKEANLAPARRGYFHYAVVAFLLRDGGVDRAGGIADLLGDELEVAFGCNATTDWEWAATFMHELGHNLGLLHGGHEHKQLKPNYSSIMNNRYFHGLDLDCDGRSDTGPGRRLGYSDGSRPPFDEAHIVETEGVCGDVPADLDHDQVIDTEPYARDMGSDGVLSVFHDHDDLAALEFGAIVSGRGRPEVPVARILDELPLGT